MAVVISILFRTSAEYEHYRAELNFDTELVDWNHIWTAFSVFVFAFGGHSLVSLLEVIGIHSL